MVCRARRARVERGGTPRAALRRKETCCGATYRRHQVPIRGYGSDEMRRLRDLASSLVELLRHIRLTRGNHADGIVAMDLFVVPTISFRLLYGLLTIGPASAWLRVRSRLLCWRRVMKRLCAGSPRPSPSESRAANRDLDLCFVLFVNVHLYNL